MDKEKEIENIAYEICNYVKSKDMNKVYVVAESPMLEYLHNTGIAEWLVEKGYGDVRAAVKEFAERIINAFFCEFADDMTFKKASRIEKIIKEACGDEVSKNDKA